MHDDPVHVQEPILSATGLLAEELIVEARIRQARPVQPDEEGHHLAGARILRHREQVGHLQEPGELVGREFVHRWNGLVVQLQQSLQVVRGGTTEPVRRARCHLIHQASPITPWSAL